jgi:hypothetical protein
LQRQDKQFKTKMPGHDRGVLNGAKAILSQPDEHWTLWLQLQ